MITVTVRLFGIFKRFSGGSAIQLLVPDGISLKDFKNHFASKLTELAGRNMPDWDPRVVAESAFAHSTRILEAHECLHGDCTIAVLPPVCGG